MQMICILLGVPESERHWLFEAIEPSFDFGGSRKASIARLSVEEAGSRMYNYGQELIASKRAAPTDDMLSVVANAALDDSTRLSRHRAVPVLQPAVQRGRRDDAQLRSRAGCWRWPNIPTSCRAAFGSGAVADRDRGDGALDVAVAVEAAHRHAASRRSAGCEISAGQKVLVWEGSANRDASVFADADASTSPESPIRTWASARACTTASAPTWPGSSCGCCSRSCSPRFSSVQVVRPVEWTRSNRHTGIRHLVVELDLISSSGSELGCSSAEPLLPTGRVPFDWVRSSASVRRAMVSSHGESEVPFGRCDEVLPGGAGPANRSAQVVQPVPVVLG